MNWERIDGDGWTFGAGAGWGIDHQRFPLELEARLNLGQWATQNKRHQFRLASPQILGRLYSGNTPGGKRRALNENELTRMTNEAQSQIGTVEAQTENGDVPLDVSTLENLRGTRVTGDRDDKLAILVGFQIADYELNFAQWASLHFNGSANFSAIWRSVKESTATLRGDNPISGNCETGVFRRNPNCAEVTLEPLTFSDLSMEDGNRAEGRTRLNLNASLDLDIHPVASLPGLAFVASLLLVNRNVRFGGADDMDHLFASGRGRDNPPLFFRVRYTPGMVRQSLGSWGLASSSTATRTSGRATASATTGAGTRPAGAGTRPSGPQPTAGARPTGPSAAAPAAGTTTFEWDGFDIVTGPVNP